MQGKRIPPLEGHSVEVAYINGNESDVMNEIIVKLAHSIDNCDSARDVRSLIAAMIDALDRRRQLAAVDATANGPESPLSVIMGRAESV